MNEIVNKFLLAGDKFMSKMYLKQPYLQIVPVDHLQKKKRKNTKILKSRRFTIYLAK